jgi:hypothetical protein
MSRGVHEPAQSQIWSGGCGRKQYQIVFAVLYMFSLKNLPAWIPSTRCAWKRGKYRNMFPNLSQSSPIGGVGPGLFASITGLICIVVKRSWKRHCGSCHARISLSLFSAIIHFHRGVALSSFFLFHFRHSWDPFRQCANTVESHDLV